MIGLRFTASIRYELNHAAAKRAWELFYLKIEKRVTFGYDAIMYDVEMLGEY